MNWFLLLLGTLGVVEAFLFLPFMDKVRELGKLAGKIARILKSSSISDHWKEKILPAYASTLFWLSMTLFVLLLVAFLPIIIVAFAGEYFGVPVIETLSGLVGILVSTGVAIGYLFIRKRVVS